MSRTLRETPMHFRGTRGPQPTEAVLSRGAGGMLRQDVYGLGFTGVSPGKRD